MYTEWPAVQMIETPISSCTCLYKSTAAKFLVQLSAATVARSATKSNRESIIERPSRRKPLTYFIQPGFLISDLKQPHTYTLTHSLTHSHSFSVYEEKVYVNYKGYARTIQETERNTESNEQTTERLENQKGTTKDT